MTDQSKGGVDAGAPAIDPMFVGQAAAIIVKAMVTWGIVPAPLPEMYAVNAGRWARAITAARAAQSDSNGFTLAMTLFNDYGWRPDKGHRLDAKAVDMLSRLDAIAEEIQAAHERQVDQIGEAWLRGNGAGGVPVGIVNAIPGMKPPAGPVSRPSAASAVGA